MIQSLHIYIDANVYIDAFIAWGDNNYPLVSIDAEPERITGEPACALLVAVRERVLINGQPIVLHCSERNLRIVKAKLTEKYHWENAVALEAIRHIARLVHQSGGTIIREAEALSPAIVPGLNDVEDCYRIAEARHCAAELFITRDNAVVNTGSASVRPLPIRPQAFADLSRPRP